MKHLLKHRVQRGYTAIEVVTVIILLAVVFYPLGRSLMRVLMESTEDQRLATCAFLAMERIEVVRSQSQCYTTPNAPAAPDGCRLARDKQSGWTPTEIDYNLTAPCNFEWPFATYQCMVCNKDNNEGQFSVRATQVRVWYDADGDNAWDAEEPDVILETMLSKRPPIP